MRFLHTGDWHVGKTLKGTSRLDEHRAVLAEIVAVARDRAVDVVLVAGDLFETAAPSPEAHALVWNTLLALKATGAQVLVIAGNHDNPHSFEAVRPLFAQIGITVAGHCAAADRGGVVEITSAAGERAVVALVPFVPQRHIVRAADLVTGTASEHTAAYADRMGGIVGSLTAGFAKSGAINVVLAHAMVSGGRLGGGEREAHTMFEYGLSSVCFPATAHYVALGHLHRTQLISAGCPVHYAGSPITVDFGEEADRKHVLVVEASATTPAVVEPVELMSGLRLRTLKGSLSELRAAACDLGEYERVRVYVREPGRAGLADEVRSLIPQAVEVILERTDADTNRVRPARSGRGATDLFAAFLEERGVEDPRLSALFARLLDEDVTA